ncbi:1-deoxy-D-xylulose-5-phosphate synthase [Dokdonia pacifica]|uniref:1-deoxy-D-xylulose-5-phosphate synthase n=1 Tax=Dokdonia pacifica TaxID=1627892 RepID=A0A238VYV7_9FLAO|nr:1-deoxy-D-xylulose-5-phosphate synthase [Dokdonia pacifica]GGG16364.1 1-deoxy-D-xylulose-5-phosphate synthase [Dokdonia pacifica]SNR39535.1 1-deoxy-D-xylulose-5-phosphate synthase [Dokdonia pacifica]
MLDHIDSPYALRQLSIDQLPQLSKELRQFIITVLSTKEGHLGASLGVVELTIALHYVFNTPEDKLIWDVGHQAYGHKILTGRKNIFHTNRQKGGISGFPKISESNYDTFGVGHSSTSISAALGMAIAANLQGKEEQQHIAVIGDASIASGMAFEGLNHAGVTDANLLVILNDNAIGIDPSVGALKKYLTNVKKGTAREENIFEALNFEYHGPIDGHDLPALIEALKKLQKIKGPKFLHVITTKGKGLALAEKHQITYHAPGKFDALTGERHAKDTTQLPPKYQDVFGHTIVELATINKKIIGITPAMPTGSSLKYMIETFPDRAFDVGIAEQHAVTLSAGMATQGMVVFCNIYSTFLQRAYDQIIHDVALQNLPVIFCLDRAGLVGQDGPTHHGAFDLAYLNCIPNMMIYAPKDEIALRNIMYTAQLGLPNPIAIRYPRGRGITIDWKQPFQKIEIGKGHCVQKGKRIAVLSIGTPIHHAITATQNKAYDISIYDIGFLKPIDTVLLDSIFKTYEVIITIEDGTIKGGLGSVITDYAFAKAYKGIITSLGIPDKFITHGTTEELQEEIGISPTHISKVIEKYL